MLTRRQWQGLDRPLFCATLLLLGLGFLTLYSASLQKAQALGVPYMARQLTWVALGVSVAILLVLVDYHRWLEWAYLLYGMNLLVLLVVLEMGVVRGGAQRWLTIGTFTVQPSEFAKLTTVLALARYLGARRPWTAADGWNGFLMAALILGLPMSLILMEPNLGTASVFVPIGLSILFIWGLRAKILGFLLALGSAAIPLGLHFLADYQRSRLLVFLNPNLDPLGAGYTVVQSRVAIGSGGLFGKGWLSGTQNQLNFLPERHTDFIFSVLGEEWGFFGTTVALFLFGLLFYRGILIATQTRDPFGRLLVVGLIAMLAAHVVVNIGMTMGFMPVVGLPLPFMSYGGSWTFTACAAMGIILSVGLRRPVF